MYYMKENKALHIIAIIVGVACIAAGVWFMIEPAHNYTPYGFVESATFGADFYTYQYKATKFSADLLESISQSLGNFYDYFAFVVGAFFIAIGALTVINHACKISAKPVMIAEQNNSYTAAPTPTPTYTQQSAPAQNYTSNLTTEATASAEQTSFRSNL